MPTQDLVAEFDRTREQHDVLQLSLVTLTERLAVEFLADALPGARVIEAHGETNEDWLRILRVQRVLSATGAVLFDVAEGHDDRRVEAVIDEVNEEYFDLLLDLTGDAYMGTSVIELPFSAS